MIQTSLTKLSRLSKAGLGTLLSLVILAGSGVMAWSDELVVGVRVDAPPFAFHKDWAGSAQLDPSSTEADQRLAGRPSENKFTGYVVTVCSQVLKSLEERGMEVFTRPVNARTRFLLLESEDIHVLCDPATVTRNRAARAIPSIPIYMSAITYARRAPLPALDECIPRVGFVSDTTAPHGVREILLNNTEPRYWVDVAKALQASENGESSPLLMLGNNQVCDDVPVLKQYDDHRALADDFCAGKVIFYVGDVEIVRSWLSLKDCIDSSVIAPAVYSNERYAIFFAKPSDSTPNRAILEFQMELRSRITPSSDRTRTKVPEKRSLLIEAFKGTKKLTAPSEVLRTFFWSVTGDFP